MTFVITKPQQELVPIMTQISTNRGGSSHSSSSSSNNHYSSSNIHRYSHGNLTWSLDSPSKRRRRKKSRCFLTFSFGVTVVLLLTFPYILSHVKPDSDHKKEKSMWKDDDRIETKENSGTLLQGTVEADPIAYYHQPALSPTEENHHLVLLHGSAFTKEDWKTSGILGSFQRDFPSIAITAVDLPVKADHTQLKKLLRSMRDEDLITQLPISGLVTPSASGKSITTWITQEHSQDMESYISLWVPVASYSVSSCTTAGLETLDQSGVNVLAIYGDKDRRGKKVMEKLRDHSGATLLELPGKHPVYLDSPDAFVKAIGEKVLLANK